MIQRFHPRSPTSTLICYEVYRNRDAADADFRLIADMYARVMREDKVLCSKAQENINRGVFVNGLLHPRYEKAPLFFQQGVREAVARHYEAEKREGREIWPARRRMLESVGVSDEDEEICKGLSCGEEGGGKEVLAW